MARISAHKIEEKSTDVVRMIVNQSDALFREWTRNDYGVDAVIEFFDREENRDYEVVTGKICYVQIKGTEAFDDSKIVQRENGYAVAISSDCAKYSMQDNIPFFVILSSTKLEDGFYFEHLQNPAIREILQAEPTRQDGKKTMHVPIANHIIDDITEIRAIVDQYFDAH